MKKKVLLIELIILTFFSAACQTTSRAKTEPSVSSAPRSSLDLPLNFIPDYDREAKEFLKCPAISGLIWTSPRESVPRAAFLPVYDSGGFSQTSQIHPFNLTNYEQNNSFIMAIMSGLSYLKKNPDASYVTDTIKRFGFTKISFYENSKENLEAIIASNDSDIVIVFRGTDGIFDVITDVRFVKRSFFWGKIHAGFLSRINASWEKIYQELREHGYSEAASSEETYQGSRPFPKRLWVTGHSLGAALALGFSTRIIKLESEAQGIELNSDFVDKKCTDASNLECELKCEQNAAAFVSRLAGVYGFATPPVGNNLFARCVNAVLKDKHFRHVNYLDPVPGVHMLMPLDIGYKQPKQLVVIKNDLSILTAREAAEFENTIYRKSSRIRDYHRIKHYINGMSKLMGFDCPLIR